MNKETKDKKEEISISQKEIERLKKILVKIESQINHAKGILFNSDFIQTIHQIDTKNAVDFIEGFFDGEQMITKDKKIYQVSANYASKSKLIVGDLLKLVIAPDGTYIYKQIAPAARKKIIGVLEKSGDKYRVKTQNKYYNVLLASITFFKAGVGDKLTIIVPKDKDSDWAAVENKIE